MQRLNQGAQLAISAQLVMIDVHCYLPSSQAQHNLTLQCEITALPSTLFNHKQYVPEAFRTRESSRETDRLSMLELIKINNFTTPKKKPRTAEDCNLSNSKSHWNIKLHINNWGLILKSNQRQKITNSALNQPSSEQKDSIARGY